MNMVLNNKMGLFEDADFGKGVRQGRKDPLAGLRTLDFYGASSKVVDGLLRLLAEGLSCFQHPKDDIIKLMGPHFRTFRAEAGEIGSGLPENCPGDGKIRGSPSPRQVT